MHGASRSTDRPLLFFIHVPKTAGSSIFQILHREYGNRFGAFLQMDLDQWRLTLQQFNHPFDCVFGHYRFGIHDTAVRPYEYTAFLRDPVEAILSYIYFINGRIGDWPFLGSSRRIEADRLLELPGEFLNTYFRNYQTSMLLGRPPDSADAVIRHAETHFPILGITELYHESVYLLKRRYGWGPVVVYYANATPNRPTRHQFSKKTLQTVQDLVATDIAVHRYAKERLLQAVRSLSAEEKALIEKFKKTGRLDE